MVDKKGEDSEELGGERMGGCYTKSCSLQIHCRLQDELQWDVKKDLVII